MSPDEKLWERFCGEFDAAVFKCAHTGEQTRLRVGIGSATVVIDVYPSGGSMKKFDEMNLRLGICERLQSGNFPSAERVAEAPMTSAIQKAIEASRRRERERMKTGHSPFKQEYRFREALAVAVEELTGYLKTSYRLRAEKSLLRIAKVLEGK